MKPDKIQHLESLAAKNAAIMIEATTLIELRAVVEWARRAHVLLLATLGIYPVEWDHGDMDTKIGELVQSAPADVRGE